LDCEEKGGFLGFGGVFFLLCCREGEGGVLEGISFLLPHVSAGSSIHILMPFSFFFSPLSYFLYFCFKGKGKIRKKNLEFGVVMNCASLGGEFMICILIFIMLTVQPGTTSASSACGCRPPQRRYHLKSAFFNFLSSYFKKIINQSHHVEGLQNSKESHEIDIRCLFQKFV
jgi:hypothetical protein